MQNSSDQAELVADLCAHFVDTASDDELQKEVLQHASAILNSPTLASTNSTTGELSLTQQIKRKLNKSGKTGVADKFSSLTSELQKLPRSESSERLNQLQFLYYLNQENKKTPTTVNVSGRTVGSSVSGGGSSSRSQVASAGKTFVLHSSVKASSSSGHYTPTHTTATSINRSEGKTQAMSSESPFTPPSFSLDPKSLWSSSAGTTNSSARATSLPPAPPSKNSTPGSKNRRNSGVVLDESVLVKDCLFMIQGIDGEHLRWDSRRDRIVISSSVRLSYGDRQKVERICEYFGWMFVQVKSFVDSHPISTQPGLIATSFSAALSEHIGEYYGLLGDLQKKTDMVLSELLIELYNWESKLELLCELIHRIREDPIQGIGGKLIENALFFVYHGNPVYQRVAVNLLEKLCRPLKSRIIVWMCDGILDDPHDEFFISENAGVTEDDFWDKRFSVRESMLPYCSELSLGLSPAIAHKILSTGKAIIFLRSMCKERGGQMEALEGNRDLLRDVDMVWTYDFTQTHKFEKAVDTCHLNANGQVLKALENRYHMKHHFAAMNKYLLLTHGGFCTAFLDLLHWEFRGEDPLASTGIINWDEGFMGSKQHRLSTILSTAVEQCNAVYEIQDVKDRLDVRVLEFDDETSGVDCWGSVMLKYNVDGPIKALFPEEVMVLYARLFDCFWSVKRLDFVMSRVDAGLIHESRNVLAEIPETAEVLHKFQLVAAELRTLEICLLSYFSEAIGAAWSSFQADLGSMKDMDSLIRRHKKYLKNCLCECLLDQDSEELQTQLRTLWTVSQQFIAAYRRFATECQKELDERREWRLMEHRNTLRGDWAYDSKKEYWIDRRAAVKNLTGMKQNLNVIHDVYRECFSKLLMSLCNQRKEKLRNFTLVLDFNEFFEKLEPEIEVSRRFSRVSQLTKK